MPDDGLISIASPHSAARTADRLAANLEAGGLTVFARIDHAANAAGVDLALRPTQLLIFGNPRAGTILMQDNQASGLDLPFRALVWEDADNRVWVTYNDPQWLARRYHLQAVSGPVIQAVQVGMEKMIAAAVA